jgi:hypothetical protein
MSSDKFVRSCEFHKQDPETVKKRLLNTVPNDISDQDKANYLNWRIKQFMINGGCISPDAKSVEIFYMIKDNNLDHFLAKNDINKIQSVSEFEQMMKVSSEKYLKYQSEQEEMKVKPGDINKIAEYENWEVFVPESKAASIKLGTGTSWCTASRGSGNAYNLYHTPEDPLIIFINKQDPTEKYQFHYSLNNDEESQFKDKNDNEMPKNALFAELHSIILTCCNGKLPDDIVSAAFDYHRGELDDGCYEIITPKSTYYYDKDDNLHRDDGPAVQDSCDSDGREIRAWYTHGKLNRRDGPALMYTQKDYGEQNNAFWYTDGLLNSINDEPASIVEDEDGCTIETWYTNGVINRDGDKPASILLDFNGEIVQRSWYKNGKKIKQISLPAAGPYQDDEYYNGR